SRTYINHYLFSLIVTVAPHKFVDQNRWCNYIDCLDISDSMGLQFSQSRYFPDPAGIVYKVNFLKSFRWENFIYVLDQCLRIRQVKCNGDKIWLCLLRRS